MAQGFRTSQALYVVSKLGIPDLLINGPSDCNQLASRLHADGKALFRVMRALAAQGIFTQDSTDRFGLTPMSQLLRSDTPGSMRYDLIFFGEEYYRAAGEMLHTVKTGETAFNHIYGKSHFDYLGENPEASKIFNLAMAGLLAHHGNPLESYDFRGRHLIVDVGGGRGDLVVDLLKSNPGVEGIIYDLPQGLSEAKLLLKSAGIADRCQIITGSFFESVPTGGDVYLMSRILHDWQDNEAKKILNNCRKAIREDGVLLLREAVIPEGDTPSAGKQLDLTMLFLVGGRERTEKEWHSLLHETGFALERVIKSKRGAFDIIEATPR